MMTSLVCVDMCELIQFWCAYLSNCSVRNAPYQNADVSFYENCCCLWPKNRKIGERRGLEIGFFAHVVFMSDGVISHSNMKGFFLSIENLSPTIQSSNEKKENSTIFIHKCM